MKEFLKKYDLINDRKPTNQLFMLPLFLGLLGGVLMYFIAKKDDRKMAVQGLIVGIIVSIIFITIIQIGMME
ncbi:MAG: hypothetical protein NPMRTH4_140003 [Nitrosopumilales archaeon]|nr:MAG: hypothetical protein NPMRTH4_140003 [Nitrosopumilales archaeon]